MTEVTPVERNLLIKTQAYQWLANQMGIPATQTHIAMFDIDRCQQVVKLMQLAKHASL